MVPMWVEPSLHASPNELEALSLIARYIFLDSLRRRITWWLLWAARSNNPHIIVSAQAPEKRTSSFRRRGRERRLGTRRGKGFPHFLSTVRFHAKTYGPVLGQTSHLH
jgi:hypothetical protein